MERSLDKTNAQQTTKTDEKLGKHEGVRENRPERPLAADGKKDLEANEPDADLASKGAEGMGEDKSLGQNESNEAPQENVAEGQTEQTESRDEVKLDEGDEEKPSQGI